jgi:mannose-6-phosphate isomerase-like protein (cupin superfamily)
MDSAHQTREAMIVPPGEGRLYEMGRMKAIFKADCDETGSGYSVSEWWVEPHTRGPGAHSHSDDHVFFVIEGTLNLIIDGTGSEAERGAYVVIPGGTPHDFENRGSVRCGFISLNVPGGFEKLMPRIAPALAEADLSL